jgi:hypothetical protein
MSSEETQSDGKQDPKFELYKMMFEQYAKTRDERTDYNKWYTNLLFIQTLVAVSTAVLTAKTEILSSTLTKGLLMLVFAAGAVIAFTWFLKLIALNEWVCSQKRALIKMEEAKLIPFEAVKTEDDYLKAYLGENSNEPSSIFKRRRRALNWNYYMLPLVITGLFVFAVILVGIWGINFTGALTNQTGNLTTNVTNLTTNVTNLI